MKPKEMVAIGIPQDCINTAINVIKEAIHSLAYGSKSKVEAMMSKVVGNPELFVDEEQFGALAKAIIVSKDKAAKEADKLADNPYRTAQKLEFPIWNKDDIDPAAIKQMEEACELPVAVAGALCGDAHVGYSVPIGGVLATYNSVIPMAVGVDISCSVKLSVLDTDVKKFKDIFSPKIDTFIRALNDGTVFGVGGCCKIKQNHSVMDMNWNCSPTTKSMKDKAWSQLGTSGSGNHFVEFGILTLEQMELGLDPGSYIALLSHSGSRGAGANVCSAYDSIAKSKLPKQYERFKNLAWLSLDSEAGQEYWNAMNLMYEYASANHEIIHRRVSELVGAEILTQVKNSHNLCIPKTEKIPCLTGYKTIDQIVAGDLIYAVDRKKGLVTTEVDSVWYSGKKKIYTIRTPHRKIRVSGDHPIWTVRVTKKAHPFRTWHKICVGALEWVEAKNLSVGDIIICSDGYYQRNHNVQEGLPRFIGAYLGDGWTRANAKNRYDFGLAIGDKTQSLWHNTKRNTYVPKYYHDKYLSGIKIGHLDLPSSCFAERIESIKITDEEDTWDLQVKDENHSFICEGVVVHNCWKEVHDGRELIVHRKGATPASEGELGVIPGSMADPAFVVRGKGKAESLRSASHGAGRRMSRRAAIKSFNWQHWKSVLKEREVRLISAGLDEVPGSYKNILEVMNAQTDLVSIVARFDPKIVKMSDDGKAED
jgi:tRNA-splicing ligase RtcB (3'-phosphate/5'-hydroxy nucleic acid ligase)